VFALFIDFTSHGAGASANRHRVTTMRKAEE
jgi:hypothetical protein